MRFGARLPNDTATLLLLAVFIDRRARRSPTGSATGPATHTVAISVVGAVVPARRLRVLAAGAICASDRARAAPRGRRHGRAAVRARRSSLLAVAGVGAALVSDWFVNALDPAVEVARHLEGVHGPRDRRRSPATRSRTSSGITLAAQGQEPISRCRWSRTPSRRSPSSSSRCSSCSRCFFAHRLTFVVNPVYIGALALTAIAVWQITGDGEAAAFEGWALVGLYVILAALTWYE